MDAPVLPNISTVSTLSHADCNQILDALFEPSEHLHRLAEPLFPKKYPSYLALVDAVKRKLIALTASRDPNAQVILFSILSAHPRLGERAPGAEKTACDAPEEEGQMLSEMSKAEQANLHSAGQKESAETLAMLNREYEKEFPGLRYVTFVNGRGRDLIINDMRYRINRGIIDLEIVEIIEAICAIARDRARKLQPSTINSY